MNVETISRKTINFPLKKKNWHLDCVWLDVPPPVSFNKNIHITNNILTHHQIHSSPTSFFPFHVTVSYIALLQVCDVYTFLTSEQQLNQRVHRDVGVAHGPSTAFYRVAGWRRSQAGQAPAFGTDQAAAVERGHAVSDGHGGIALVAFTLLCHAVSAHTHTLDGAIYTHTHTHTYRKPEWCE